MLENLLSFITGCTMAVVVITITTLSPINSFNELLRTVKAEGIMVDDVDKSSITFKGLVFYDDGTVETYDGAAIEYGASYDNMYKVITALEGLGK